MERSWRHTAVGSSVHIRKGVDTPSETRGAYGGWQVRMVPPDRHTVRTQHSLHLSLRPQGPRGVTGNEEECGVGGK